MGDEGDREEEGEGDEDEEVEDGLPTEVDGEEGVVEDGTPTEVDEEEGAAVVSGRDGEEVTMGTEGAAAGACGRKKTKKAKRRTAEMMMAERMMRRERVVCRIFRRMSSVVWKRLAGSWAVHRLMTLL